MAQDMRITLAFKRIFTLRHTGYVRVDLSIRVILVGEDRKPQVTEFKQDELPHCPSSLSSMIIGVWDSLNLAAPLVTYQGCEVATCQAPAVQSAFQPPGRKVDRDPDALRRFQEAATPHSRLIKLIRT